jgi:hypothetical protein
MGRDEPRVLRWIGLPGLQDGERLWFDLAAAAAGDVRSRQSMAG